MKAVKLLKFGAVGGFGVLVNTAVLYVLTSLGMHYLPASLAATETAIISNFINNHLFTFRGDASGTSLVRKFLSFQAISMLALFGTASILWLLVTLLGERLLLVWNVIAILIMFMANFALNSRYTWPGAARQPSKAFRLVALASVLLFSAAFASGGASAADLVAVSQMGYHPDSHKQVVVYGSAGSGTAFIHRQDNNAVVAEYPLAKAKNYYGSDVECQGSNPCIVADFSDFKVPGNYYVKTDSGSTSPAFTISSSVFASNVPVLLEFFNAELQQGSAYHADMHSGYSPPLPAIADGSFIMESHQAALPLIRLGSAYRTNPALFAADNYNIVEPGKPDMQEYIITYVDYLEGLQGLQIEYRSDGSGFRLDRGLKIRNAFVPGPTNLTSLDIYIPENPPRKLETVPVVSLCGSDNGSDTWDACISNAAAFYKCQIDEPCLDMAYIDQSGVVAGRSGYAVSRGWGYEFACFFDVTLSQPMFGGKPNPCMIFYPDSSRQLTAEALLGFLEAVPAVHDFSAERGEALLSRAVSTYQFVKASYPAFSSSSNDAGFWGAALFLLYDYTGEPSYLAEAHGMRNKVSTTFIPDKTNGNEFYWEEYIRHKAAIEGAGLAYGYNDGPENFFVGKMYFDYKDNGYISVSNNGERVFQFEPNIQFQNSRYMLTEGVLAAKTMELSSAAPEFAQVIADSQLAWLTGMNGVQEGVSLNSTIGSISFIYGIGSFPEKFHSRYLIDTGYLSQSGGKVIGVRGTDLFFHDGTNYVYLDGRTEMLGREFGAIGNQHSGPSEPRASISMTTKLFNNGLSYIPGWISGAFDINTPAETDVIYNFRDSTTYEFTEATNEIGATALELFAYMDAAFNNRARHPLGAQPASNSTTTPPANQTNSTNSTTTPPVNQTNSTTTPPINQTNSTTTPPVNQTNSTTTPPINQTNSTTTPPINQTNSTIPPVNQTNTTQPPLNQSSSANSSSAKFNSQSTNLSRSNSSSPYRMFETDTARFQVALNQSAPITWTINSEVVKQETGLNSTLDWTPALLYTSNVRRAVVNASTGSKSVQWDVDVEFVLNPFFSAIDGGPDILGSPDTKIHVISNMRKVNFSELSVVLESEQAGSAVRSTYALAVGFANNSEVDWRRDISDMPVGNSYVVEIIGYDNQTNSTQTYQLNKSRAHFRNYPQESSSSSSSFVSYQSSSSGGGGGGLEASSANPQVVYALFAFDVLNVSQVQTLTLDAKVSRGDIFSVQARILTPKGGYISRDLEFTRGSRTYGTWQASFTVSAPGRYVLDKVLIQANDASPVERKVNGTSFYAVSTAVQKHEHLMLVNALLNETTVDYGEKVLLSVDARDGSGLTNVTALVTKSRAGATLGSFVIPLKLAKGGSQYGTWQAVISADEQDSTFAVTEVSLSNSNSSKAYSVAKRSFYVRPVNSGGAQGRLSQYILDPVGKAGRWSVDRLRRMPLVPTLLGFGGAVAIASLFATRNGIRQRFVGNGRIRQAK